MSGSSPGLGGSVVDWIAYGHTVQTTKDKSRFGSGEIRGVIGPESSNNAKEGGGLVPTLLFGIPGSGSMAIFIGAIALLGSGNIEVGPSMLKNNLDITYAIVWLLALANVVGTLICIGASGGIARLTTIPFSLLAPFLFMIIAFAAFQSGQDLMDLVALFVIGFLGIMMRRFDWSRPAFLIGFVLSNPAETYANQAVQIAQSRFRKGFAEGIDYIFSPIVIVLIIITLISIVVGLRQAKMIMAEGAVESGKKKAPMIFLLAVLAYLLISFVDASLIPDYAAADRVFPRFVSGVAIVGALILLVQMIVRPESHALFADRDAGGNPARCLRPLVDAGLVCGPPCSDCAPGFHPCTGPLPVRVHPLPRRSASGFRGGLHRRRDCLHVLHGMAAEPGLPAGATAVVRGSALAAHMMSQGTPCFADPAVIAPSA